MGCHKLLSNHGANGFNFSVICMIKKNMCVRSKRCKSIGFTLLCSIAILTNASAQNQSVNEYQKTVRQLGAQTDYFYVSFNEPFTLNCAYGVAYIASVNKGLYAQLLAAKMSGKRISRLVYSQSGGTTGSCNVELVEISD